MYYISGLKCVSGLTHSKSHLNMVTALREMIKVCVILKYT